ncbi:DUF4276 family protein, partial [Campylobacter jejuni]|nr:DUF4276 family protein [Campylobacter jejuni]MFI80864.1 DUF4276 family protein [Campylobacter jejuni]
KKILSFPSYNKILHGGRIAKEIGIDNIRLKCRHFNKWCEKIHSLGNKKENSEK